MSRQTSRLCLPLLVRMWTTCGVSSILSSTFLVNSTCTSARRPSSSVPSTAATAPWCSSLSPTQPYMTRWGATGRTSQTTSPSPSSPRHVSCLPSAYRCEEPFLFRIISSFFAFVRIGMKRMTHSLKHVFFQLGLEMSYWTAVNTFFVLGSLAMYFVVTFTMYSNGLFLTLPSAFHFIGEW